MNTRLFQCAHRIEYKDHFWLKSVFSDFQHRPQEGIRHRFRHIHIPGTNNIQDSAVVLAQLTE